MGIFLCQTLGMYVTKTDSLIAYDIDITLRFGRLDPFLYHQESVLHLFQ